MLEGYSRTFDDLWITIVSVVSLIKKTETPYFDIKYVLYFRELWLIILFELGNKSIYPIGNDAYYNKQESFLLDYVANEQEE